MWLGILLVNCASECSSLKQRSSKNIKRNLRKQGKMWSVDSTFLMAPS